MQPSVVHEEPILRVVTCGNLFIAAWSDAPTAAQMKTVFRHAQALKQRHPLGTAMANLIVRGTPRFSSDVREEAAATTRAALHNLGAADLVLVGGLAGAAVRAFLGTAILLGRAKNPTRVFSSADDASRWLAGQLPNGPVAGWTVESVRGAIAFALDG